MPTNAFISLAGSVALTIANALTAQGESAIARQIDQRIHEWCKATDRSAARLTQQLIRIGEGAEPHLRGLLDQQLHPKAVEPMVLALGRIRGSSACVGTIARLLDSTDDRHRISAVTALGDMGHRASLPHLFTALDDPAEAVRNAAARSFGNVSRMNPDLDALQWLRNRLQARQPPKKHEKHIVALQLVLEKLAESRGKPEMVARVEGVIRDWLAAPNPSPKKLTQELVEIGRDALPYLRARLRGRPSASLAGPLALAVAQFGAARESVEAIASLLSSTENGQRIAGVAALGAIAAPEVIRHLIAALDDRVGDVRAAAAAAMLLVVQKNPEAELLAWHGARLCTLQHKDHVALFLGRVGTPHARELLRDCLVVSTAQKDVMAILSGLWLCGKAEDATPVRKLLDHGDQAVRRKVCLLLGKLGDRHAIRGLIDCMREDVRGLSADAHWALLRITKLHLRADAALWEAWWQRVGKKRAQSAR